MTPVPQRRAKTGERLDWKFGRGRVLSAQISNRTSPSESIVRFRNPMTQRTSAVHAGLACLTGASLIIAMLPVRPAAAQSAPQESAESAVDEGPKYSPDVVAKAERILEEAGLRRSGKEIQATGAAKLSRAMTSLTRDRRELKLVHDEWKRLADQDTALRGALAQRNLQEGALNLQLTRIDATNVTAHNRVVAQINANRAATRAQLAERQKLKPRIDAARGKLNDAEAAYAETVLAIRKDLDALQEQIDEALTDKNVQIALQVMQRNFDAAGPWTAERILESVERRLRRIEQEVFSESIPLEVEPNGSLYVTVAVGGRTARMVVDSGASMISLPAATAKSLGVEVPPDAKPLQILLADGSVIMAREVTLDSVRVGQFEAEDVAAAVLDPLAANAEPLLGMTFLGHFKFEVNAAERTLTMLRVAAD